MNPDVDQVAPARPKRRRYGPADCRIGMARTVLALEMMADDQAVVRPTYRRLAAEVGRSEGTVQYYLGRLEGAGLIRYYPPRLYRVTRVTVVLMDHPDAAAAVARLDKLERRRNRWGQIVRPWRSR